MTPAMYSVGYRFEGSDISVYRTSIPCHLPIYRRVGYHIEVFGKYRDVEGVESNLNKRLVLKGMEPGRCSLSLAVEKVCDDPDESTR